MMYGRNLLYGQEKVVAEQHAEIMAKAFAQEIAKQNQVHPVKQRLNCNVNLLGAAMLGNSEQKKEAEYAAFLMQDKSNKEAREEYIRALPKTQQYTFWLVDAAARAYAHAYYKNADIDALVDAENDFLEAYAEFKKLNVRPAVLKKDMGLWDYWFKTISKARQERWANRNA